MTTDSHPDQPTGPLEAQLGRRVFLRRGAIGAGAVAVAALVPTLAMNELGGGAEPAGTASNTAPLTGEPMMVYVRDAERGEAVIMSGANERVVVDRVLVQHLLRAQDRHLA